IAAPLFPARPTSRPIVDGDGVSACPYTSMLTNRCIGRPSEIRCSAADAEGHQAGSPCHETIGYAGAWGPATVRTPVRRLWGSARPTSSEMSIHRGPEYSREQPTHAEPSTSSPSPHAETTEAVLARYGVDPERGLDQADVGARRARHGANQLREAP